MTASTLSGFVNRHLWYRTGCWLPGRGVAVCYDDGRFVLRVWNGKAYSLVDDPTRIRCGAEAA
jgi:hypothetical protein